MRGALSREMRIFLAAVGAATVLAVVITVAAALATRRPPPPVAETLLPAGTESGLDVTELELPRAFLAPWKDTWYPSRPRLKRWGPDQVKGFWIDPLKAGIASITAENDADIRELLRQVP